MAKAHLRKNRLAAGEPKDRIKHLVRMANEREQVLGPRVPLSQFFALRSPAPVHRIAILIA